MPCDDGIRSSIAVLNARCAAVITRHSDHSERRVGAADDGDQDVDTDPEPDLRETARPSVAALRSVGDHDVGVVQEPVEEAGGGGVFG
jgi:hypothetical protein